MKNISTISSTCMDPDFCNDFRKNPPNPHVLWYEEENIVWANSVALIVVFPKVLLQEEEKGFICLLKTVDAYSYKEDDVRK